VHHPSGQSRIQWLEKDSKYNQEEERTHSSIRTRTCGIRSYVKCIETRTGAESLVSPLELLARRVVLALGVDALEVVTVVLETVSPTTASSLDIAKWLV
jgi:hypothetical protein